MEFVILIGIMILAAIIIMAAQKLGVPFEAFRKHSNENTNEHNTTPNMQTEETNHDYSGLKPRDLIIAILKNLNCKIEFDDEDPERIYFTYQGETFCTNADNECLMVTIYDFSWGSVDIDDIDEVSNLRKAINTTNLYSGLCAMYTMDIEHHRMIVHTKRQILLTPEIPNIENYLMAMLSGFFDTQRTLSKELDKLRESKGKE